MEDDVQDGPFSVWQILNAPTMVLFNDLERAAAGLDWVLTSILKSSRDFSEVLVPRPGSSKYPDNYYKAFNTWLIGRLFYVWSVKELERIHGSSKNAQLKILNILCLNGASFYESLHTEYFKILKQLSIYYSQFENSVPPREFMLNHFDTENIEIPNAQLDLSPIFVCVKDADGCEKLTQLTLSLLSESILSNGLYLDKNKTEYNELFKTVLYMLENYSLNIKLYCFKFFNNIVHKDSYALIQFGNNFPNVLNDLYQLSEAMVTTMPFLYVNNETNNEYIEDFNKYIINLLTHIKYTGEKCNKEVCLTIISTVLNPENSRIFKKDLKLLCLSLTSLDTEVQICIKNKDSTEICALRAFYVQNIIQHFENEADTKNWHLEQVLEGALAPIVACRDIWADMFLVQSNLEKSLEALNILQHVCLQVKKGKISEQLFYSKFSYLSKILQIFAVMYKSNKESLVNESKIADNLMKIAIGLSLLLKEASLEIKEEAKLAGNDISKTFDIQFLNMIDDNKKAYILETILISHIVLNIKLNRDNNEKVTYILNLLKKNRIESAYKLLIRLSPFLLLNQICFESKIIGDILMPALLTKNVDLQKSICETLPVIACMSLGLYSLIMSEKGDKIGHSIYSNDVLNISVVCSKCHNSEKGKLDPEKFIEKINKENIVLTEKDSKMSNDSMGDGQKKLFAKFLNVKSYSDLANSGFVNVIERLSNHALIDVEISKEMFNESNQEIILEVLRPFIVNIFNEDQIDAAQKDSMFNICMNLLVDSTRTSLENNDYTKQIHILDRIWEFGTSPIPKVVLPSTKLLVYFIMHPQSTLGPKAVVYLRDICEAHDSTPNQTYHRYKKDYCRLFVDCSLYNGKDFAISLLKVVRAFGFFGYIDFISKDVHHFLPYLIPYSVEIKEVPSIIEEIASLVQCSVSDFLIEKFPHVYTHIYLYESERVSKKCFDLIEKLTKTSILNLIRKHFRVILTEFLLQYCCNPEKVLNACRYLATHDPEVSSNTPACSINMTTSQVADFLHPKFLGVLAYFDQKLVNGKVALSVKRKALQSFPDIMKLMGVKYLTPLRFKVLATLRSAMSLVKEFPKIFSAAWSAFIHNIDSVSLGPLLSNLAVSLLEQLDHAPHEINKIFQYLVLSNENLLSSHISDLFFLEDSNVSEKVKSVIKRHVKRTQPEGFLDKIKWYLQHLNQDIPTIKAYAFAHLDKLLKVNRTEIHKAIFGGKTIDPVIVELIDSLLIGCKDSESAVSQSSGACLGQLGAIEAAHLPRQYVQPDRSPFAFSISDDCFAATALLELTRAFQYEKDTKNMDCYALTIQEILKIYNISPNGDKKDLWDSFPEHMHQIMSPLLSSRYTLAYPPQPKKAHPLYGSTYATTFLEWAHNWASQLIPLIESESIRELLCTVHPSMRRDVRTLFFFLPYLLLHAIMSKTNTQFIQEEVLAVIGLENFENENRLLTGKLKHKLLRHIRMTPTVSSVQAEEGNQSKCSKTIYTLFDFLNRWLLEWCHSKQHPLQNENYKAISSFLKNFDKLTIAKGNFMCGEFERALQYLELYMDECKDQMQDQLPFLAEIYALLDEPDSVAGILSIKRSEPSLKELILAQVVTGRLQDAALCYERLAQEGQLDKHSLQGMTECYLSLDQPFTSLRLLSESGAAAHLAAEPLWRLGRFEQLDELARKPVPPSKENWGLLMGRILLNYRSQDDVAFEYSCKDCMSKLLSQIDGESKGESALRNAYQSVLGLHVVKETQHADEMLKRLKRLSDGSSQASEVMSQLLDEWRRRLSVVQSDVRTVEPLLRVRRILLQQTQHLLEPSHPMTAGKLKSCIGNLWLQSAKQARKAGILQQSYMYILNAEEYQPEELFLEKAKMYWARGQQEQAFTTLRRGLDDAYPELNVLTQEQRKTCAKAKLLIAKYNDETTNVDVDVNIGYYKEAVEVCKQWEKSLVCLGAYYEKVSSGETPSSSNSVWSRRIYALNSYGKALQYGHKYLYQSMPRMLSIWLDVEVTSSDPNAHAVLVQMTEIIKTYSERLPLYLYITAFSQIVSRICHPVKEVYSQLKAILVKLILAYPQHTLWMMMSVIKSSYPQRMMRCQEVFSDPRLKEPQMLKLVCDFTQLAEKLIELCNKPISGNPSSTTVSTLVRTLPRLLASDNFSHIMMPFQEFCKIVLPSKAARRERIHFNIPVEPSVYIASIQEQITILPSLQKPRKVTLKGSDGKSYIIMLKPRDDLRRDYRLMEFNAVVNRFLQDAAAARRRRLYIRTYCVLPLNEECGLIEWVPHLVGLRPILMHIYKQKGIHTSNRELKEMMCANKDPVEKKRRIYEEKLLPRHPPVFQEWFRRVFSDPYGWYQARSAYIRTTAVMSMVGYILGLGDRHGENISFDSTNGDTVHVDFNCLFNKGEAFEWPERVPFRLTHNMEAAMGPLSHEGMFRKSCETVMRALREQTLALMSVVGPFVYDPLVSWSRSAHTAERTNEQALAHLRHIRHRINGMVRTKNKQLSLSLSPEGQVEHLIVEATSIHNLCQMYIGWGPFL